MPKFLICKFETVETYSTKGSGGRPGKKYRKEVKETIFKTVYIFRCFNNNKWLDLSPPGITIEWYCKYFILVKFILSLRFDFFFQGFYKRDINNNFLNVANICQVYIMKCFICFDFSY